MARIIAVHSLKGGSGKTSLALNLAGVSALARQDRTLLWDLDAHGSATFMFSQQSDTPSLREIFERKISPSSLIQKTLWAKLEIIGADRSLRDLERILQDIQKPRRLKKILRQISVSYDTIILDCPPGLNEVNDQVFQAADMIVIPVIPNPLGARAYEQIKEYLASKRLPPTSVFPIISMLNKRKRLHQAFDDAHPNWPVLHLSSLIEKVVLKRAPIEAFSPKSEPAEMLRYIWTEVLKKLDNLENLKRAKEHRGRPQIPKPSAIGQSER